MAGKAVAGSIGPWGVKIDANGVVGLRVFLEAGLFKFRGRVFAAGEVALLLVDQPAPAGVFPGAGAEEGALRGEFRETGAVGRGGEAHGERLTGGRWGGKAAGLPLMGRRGGAALAVTSRQAYRRARLKAATPSQTRP